VALAWRRSTSRGALFRTIGGCLAKAHRALLEEAGLG